MITFKIIRKIILFIIIFFVFILFHTNKIIAYEYFFKDSFENDYLDLTKWNISTNSGNIVVENNSLNLSSQEESFPFIFSNKTIFPQSNNFIFEISFQYYSTGGWGDGIVLSTNIPQMGYQLVDDYNVFGIWQDAGPLRLSTSVCSADNLGCNENISEFYTTKQNDFDIHTLKIEYNSGFYKLFFDNLLIFTSSLTSKIPKFVWVGHYWSAYHGGTWSNFKIFNISVKKISSLFTPTLLIPGLGASWNTKAMMTGTGGEEWKMVPFCSVYDNFRQTFIDNGYNSTNYQEFYYDWRKEIDSPSQPPNNYLVYDLKQKIDEMSAANNNEKVNLVGHGMGGLLARAYAQRYGIDKINKIVTVGSPNSGALKAYEAWEGAKIVDPQRITWADIAIDLVLYINSIRYPTRVSAIRDYAPSIKSLLPTFDYLKKYSDHSIIFTSQLNHQNDLFNLLNQDLSTNDSVKSILTTIGGQSVNTAEYFEIEKPNWIESLMGYWEDGKPKITQKTTDGDNTVLLKSSHLPNIASQTATGTHDEIMFNNEGLTKILTSLDLPFSPSGALPNQPQLPVLIFSLHSPVNMKIIGDGLEVGHLANNCDHCFYDETDEIAIINNASIGKYRIELDPIGSGGDFSLDIGQITASGDFWHTITGSTNENLNYEINFDPDKPLKNPLADPSGDQNISQTINLLQKIKTQVQSQVQDKLTKLYLLGKIELCLQLLQNTQNNNSRITLVKKSDKLLLALTQLHNLRIDFDMVFKKKKINQDLRNLLKNLLAESIENISDSTITVYNLSKQNKKSNLVKTRLEKAKKSFLQLQKKLEKKGQKNEQLGMVIFLIDEYLSAANNAYVNKDLIKSFIKITSVELFIKEAKLLI